MIVIVKKDRISCSCPGQHKVFYYSVVLNKMLTCALYMYGVRIPPLSVIVGHG